MAAALGRFSHNRQTADEAARYTWWASVQQKLIGASNTLLEQPAASIRLSSRYVRAKFQGRRDRTTDSKAKMLQDVTCFLQMFVRPHVRDPRDEAVTGRGTNWSRS